jgi:hypothetical protein
VSIFDGLDFSNLSRNPFDFLGQDPSTGAVPAAAPPAPAPQAPVAAPQGLLGGVQPSAAPDEPAAAPAAPQGLLARIMAPSPDGLTFQDKLFAAGGILKGDSKGAGEYLEKRRTGYAKSQADAQKLKDAQDKQDAADQLTQIMAKNYGPHGLDFGGVVRDAAAAKLHPSMEDMKRGFDMQTPNDPLNMGRAGGAYMVPKFGGGPAVQVVAPQAPQAPYGVDATTGLDTAAHLQNVLAEAQKKREGAPPVGRAPPKGPARGAFDPSEVTRKNPGR